MDIEQLEQIINILKANDVTEFELQQDGTHIKLSRASKVKLVSQDSTQLTVEPAVSGTVNGGIASASQGEVKQDYADLTPVTSPIVGTFYRKPAPDAEPFVNVGDHVKEGQTLCIVEAMKLMNEIPAPCDGKIEKILLSDGQVVEYGETLFLIDPAG
ncbi:MAG: acetyl-CoA carboxylase biotin carboxyl carrier protein [Candidatus Dadabacteria bacterium]|nr:MAG: acetyl-CoA carboxylase biotin carboxyl carrier protein [Candidatus Dadabacteria bacterium]